MASLAQDESRNISENVTWGQRKRMADGKVSMPYKQFLGYRKGEDGTPEIVEEEAEVVRLIFSLFIEGKTPSAIAKMLTESGIPSPAGKEKWHVSTVRSILAQEKMAGQARLQKVFTVNYLTKTRKKNEGELPSFWVNESHPAIIAPEEFEAVQAEIARRNATSRPQSCTSPFSSRIICGCCGANFGKKVWGSYKNDKSRRREVFRCNDKYKAKPYCNAPFVTEEQVMTAFLSVWNGMADNREALISDCKAAKKTLTDCAALEAEIAELQREIDVTEELSRKLIYEASRGGIASAKFTEQNDGYLARNSVAKEKVAELEAEIHRREQSGRLLGKFIHDMKAAPLALTEFDEKLWLLTVDCVTVQLDGTLVFRLKDGTEITA
jgi:hypothetical protein